jgi:hypothetical protein
MILAVTDDARPPHDRRLPGYARHDFGEDERVAALVLGSTAARKSSTLAPVGRVFCWGTIRIQ